MTALIIIAAVLVLLFVFVFFLKCGIVFRYNTEKGDFSVYLRVLFLRIPLFPRKESKKTKNISKTKKPKHITTPKETKSQQSEPQKQTLSEKAKKLSRLIKMLSVKLSKLVPGVFGALSLDVKKLHIVVGGADDAAQAAVSYGALCAAAQTVFALETQFSKGRFVTGDVDIDVDYLLSGFFADLEIVLGVRAIKVISAIYLAEDAYYTYKNNL